MSQKWIVAVAHNSMNTPRTIQSQGRQTMTCVCLLMGLEDPGGDEAAATELALVRFLPGVWAHMLLQVAGLLKALVAILASVTQRKAQAPWTHSTSEMLPLRWKQARGPPQSSNRGQKLEGLQHVILYNICSNNSAPSICKLNILSKSYSDSPAGIVFYYSLSLENKKIY